jgi:hypothetical protein
MSLGAITGKVVVLVVNSHETTISWGYRGSLIFRCPNSPNGEASLSLFLRC